MTKKRYETLCASETAPVSKPEFFFLRGIRYTVKMIQMHENIAPYVSIWMRDFNDEQVLRSAGNYNGVSYIASGNERHDHDFRAAVNVCCSRMLSI